MTSETAALIQRGAQATQARSMAEALLAQTAGCTASQNARLCRRFRLHGRSRAIGTVLRSVDGTGTVRNEVDFNKLGDKR